MKLFSHTALGLLFLLAGNTPAAVGLNHIHPNGSTSFFIDQEYEDSSGGGLGPGGRDYTGITFSYVSDNTYRYTGSFLDEGATAYLASRDDLFSEAAILEGAFTRLVFDQAYSVPFDFSYIAIRTPAAGAGGGNEIGFSRYDPAYGWLRVSSVGGELILREHAVAYSSQGIIIGTTTAIPETFSCSLSALALGSLLMRRVRP